MTDDVAPERERDHGEAIIARAMHLTSLVSACLRAARHAARRHLPPHEPLPDRDAILREAFGDPNPEQWPLERKT